MRCLYNLIIVLFFRVKIQIQDSITTRKIIQQLVAVFFLPQTPEGAFKSALARKIGMFLLSKSPLEGI
jgi:hypothetical protein